jgi:UDP-N-acetylglucosamine 4,6-dehydratase
MTVSSSESKVSLFQGKTILVTGGLGSIGSEIAGQLQNYSPRRVIILDNRETELYYARISARSNDNVAFLFGDVRDKERLLRATDGVDVIFHAAAMKHVFVCEYDPVEAVKTNAIGTQNVIECALAHNMERMVLISTDKAVNPTNVMGATKLLAERLVSAMCNYRGTNTTRFGVVRFGNVLASRGSVLENWERQLKKDKRITITNPDMTRFFMSIPESVNMIFTAADYAENGETFILKMPSIRIGDLAEVFLELKGFSADHGDIVGAGAGEKMHEGLLFEGEADLLMENQDLFVRLPLTLDFDKEKRRFEKKGFRKSETMEFSSGDKRYLLDKRAIRKVLEQQLRASPG